MRQSSVGMGSGRRVPFIVALSRRIDSGNMPAGNYTIEDCGILTWNGYQILKVTSGPEAGKFMLGMRMRPPALDETVH